MKVKDLKNRRAEQIKAQQNIVNFAKGEDRGMNEDETTKFDGLQTEIEAAEKNIERMVKFEANEKRIAVVEGKKIDGPVAVVGEERTQPFSFLRAINNAIDKKGHEGAEADAFDQAGEELRTSGLSVVRGHQIAVPSNMLFNRDVSVLGDSGTKGGKLVASTPMAVMPLLPKLALADMGATVHNGLVGDYPLISGEAFTFGYVAENGAVSGTDVNFDGPTLKPKRLSGVVDVSNQWLIQTGPTAESNLRALIAAGINAAITKGGIAGGGANGPVGIYDSITSNIQAGAAGVPTWDDIVGLETLIKSANAEERNMAYLSDPALMGKLKTTKKDAGSGVFLSENQMLNGRKHVASTLVDTLNTGLDHPLIFGDWAEMNIGFWGGISFMVDTVTQAASGKTRLVFNLYNDVALANESAFAIRKNFNV